MKPTFSGYRTEHDFLKHAPGAAVVRYMREMRQYYEIELERAQSELSAVRVELNDLRTSKAPATQDCTPTYDELHAAVARLREMLRFESKRSDRMSFAQFELQTLVGKLLDVIVLPGHALSSEEWSYACHVGGRSDYEVKS